MNSFSVVQYYMRGIPYARPLIIALLVFALGCVGFFTYRWYNSTQMEQAHAALARAIEIFDRAQQKSDQALWQEAALAFEQGIQQYAHSPLAPYFIAFQAEIALQQGHAEKARELMAQVVKDVHKDSPFYHAYIIKYARMNCDAAQPELVEQGMQELRQEALDVQNLDRDMALYYQGLIPFEKGDRAAAQKIWDLLIQDYAQDSLWAQRAQAKLDYMA